MLGDATSTTTSLLPNPDAVNSLTTVPLDSSPHHHHHAPCLRWRRNGDSVTIRAPRTRAILPALAGLGVTVIALGFAVLRLSTLPAARDTADRLGSVILLVLPVGFGLMGLFALLPLICPPRLRIDASGATLTLPTGFLLCRRRLPAGTFELRTHLWGEATAAPAGPGRLATLFLRDRQNHATYPVFHKYPASELAEIVRSLRGNMAAAPATA